MSDFVLGSYVLCWKPRTKSDTMTQHHDTKSDTMTHAGNPHNVRLQGFADIFYLQFCQALRHTIGVEFQMGVSSSSKNQRILLIEGYSVRRLGLGSYDADGIGLVTQILIQLDGRGSFWPRICDWGRSAV